MTRLLQKPEKTELKEKFMLVQNCLFQICVYFFIINIFQEPYEDPLGKMKEEESAINILKSQGLLDFGQWVDS